MTRPFFTPDTFAYLTELSLHNERPWFEANKHRYESAVREPARAFIRAMAPHLATLSPELVASDKKVGGSLMRVFRDTRFSADKTPYKTNIGIQFRLGADKDVHAPGLYFHVAPDELFLGAGMWHPPKEAVTAIRDHIVAAPETWSTSARGLGLGLELWDGEPLKRPPRGYPADHPLVEDLKRKDIVGFALWKPATIAEKDFPDRVARAYASSKKLMAFLCAALDLDF